MSQTPTTQSRTKRNPPPRVTNSISDLSLSLGKLPPQNLEAEEAVLGGILLEKGALSVCQEILKPESFYKEAHRIIFEAILFLDCKNDVVDLLTVTNQLRKTTQLEFVGGPYYLVELTQRVGSAANLEFHARIVQENALKRDLIKTSSELTRDAFDYTSDVFLLLDEAQQSLYTLSEILQRKKSAKLGGLLLIAAKEQEEKQNSESGLTGVPSGFTALDRLTNGWQKSDLIIVAARPGMGKTAFVVSAMRNAAKLFGLPIAIFSLEMSTSQLVNRLISAEAEIDGQRLTKGKLDVGEMHRFQRALGTLATVPIYIDDTPAISIMELRAKSRQLKTQYDIQMIIVDYMQLMRGTGSSQNREQEISEISRNLKALAKDLNIPVIALSQLSRATETRGGDKRPMLSDLRESGAIEQDADMVMFLYRPEYYGIEVDADNIPTRGMGEVIVAKHRNGSMDTVKLRFIGKFTKFADYELLESTPKDQLPIEPRANWNQFPVSSQDSLDQKIGEIANSKLGKKTDEAPW